MKSNYRYGRVTLLITFFIAVVLTVGIASCKPKPDGGGNKRSADNMGNMPGMDMKDGTRDSAATPKPDIRAEDLIKPVNQNAIAQIGTIRPQRSKQQLLVKAQGKIEYDQRRFTNIASRVAGRIESTNVKFQFQPVKKGEVLFTIYSPELLNAQQDFIFLSADTANKNLISAAREKLLLLGLDAQQVSEIQRTGKAVTVVSVYAPVSGYIIPNNAQQSIPSAASTVNGGMGAGMPGSSSPMPVAKVSSSVEPLLREGQYVNKGETVFRVVNTEFVWAMLKIFPDDVAKVRIGNAVKVGIDGNEPVRVAARIDFIEKYFSTEDKTVTARVYLRNENEHYKIGDLISADISAGEWETVWVPREAVLDIGNSQVVFVKQGKAFKVKEVHTGMHNGKSIELISGILPEDEIVTDVQYLVDSEAFIKTK